MSQPVGRSFEFEVEAELDVVWDMLTTPEGLATWYVESATIDGNDVTVDWGTGGHAMGYFDVVEPRQRLRLIYGTPEAGAEEWLLSHHGGVTQVKLIHSLPLEDGADWDDVYGDIVRGWRLFHATLQWAARVHRRPGRDSAVRVGQIADGAWGRILAAAGLAQTPADGEIVEIPGVPTAQVLVAVDGYSLLLAFGEEATLLVDVEGDSLYTMSATYPGSTPAVAELRSEVVDVAERLCAAAGPQN